MTMELNRILYQRSRDWLEKRPNTGILKFLEEERDKGNKGGKKGSFDDYLRGHIKTSNKTINIRGLFRVPNISQGEQLMILGDEREEENIPPIREGPQVEEAPRRDQQQRGEIPISEIEMSKPM